MSVRADRAISAHALRASSNRSNALLARSARSNNSGAWKNASITENLAVEMPIRLWRGM